MPFHRQRRHHGSRRISANRRHQGRIRRCRAQGLDRSVTSCLERASTTRDDVIDGGRPYYWQGILVRYVVQEAGGSGIAPLQQHCAMGKTLPKARFEFMRADGDGKPICYYSVELENVMISGVNPTSGEGGIINEHVFLAYSKMKWKYTKQGIRGGTDGNSAGGWDCAANKCA